ncbi:MAG: hypothetical protein ACI8ZB_003172 [Desulforhopalus sp.]|jgi:hypothetical protein
MSKTSSQLYLRHLPDVEKQITSAIERGCSICITNPTVFFRADDIGIPSLQFTQLINSFSNHKIPLCLATVPTWLNAKRLTELQKIIGDSIDQWCWHQHGYVHRNFELSGKKQEFGPARNYASVNSSLQKGKSRLELLLGPLNQPVFTPPWNRCGQETLQSLEDLGFKAISRSRGATPLSKSTFPDFQVNVDLHTRKETCPEKSFKKLLAEIEQSLATGQCGVMLHHQRMNGRALAFLDTLLQCFKRESRISFTHFGDMITSL